MRRAFLAAAAFLCLATAACGATTTTISPSATPTPDRGYDTVLEAPDEFVKTPDFTLPEATGGELTLSSLRGSEPLAVVFYRGYFCQVCRQQLIDLEGVYSDIQAVGAQVVAVSVDDAADALKLVDENGIQFPVLYDHDFTVTRSWGIFNLLDDGVAAPSMYIFNRSGDLVAYHVGKTITDRPSAREVVDALTDAAK